MQAVGKLTTALEPRRKELRDGDYVVHVHIIEARDLKSRDANGMSDPVVQVEVCGQKRHTAVKKECLNAVYDEILSFELQNMQAREIDLAAVRINVRDSSTLRRDRMIGSYVIDVSQVYYRKHHELYRQWVALTDSTGKHDGIQGYLRCSVVVLGPGDEQHTHSDKELEEDEGDNQIEVLMPPNIATSAAALSLSVFSLKDLPKMDQMGPGCDPRAVLQFCGAKARGPHAVGRNVQLRQMLSVNVQEPVMSDSVQVQLYDYDKGRPDELIATRRFSYRRLILDTPMTIHFYGADPRKSNKHANKMNLDLMQGHHYRGSALVQWHVARGDHVRAEPVVEQIAFDPRGADRHTEQWAVQCDVWEAGELPEHLGDVCVKLLVGSTVVSSHENRATKGVICFNESLSNDKDKQMTTAEQGDTTVVWGSANVDELPDVVVALYHKKKDMCISFRRCSFRQLVEQGMEVPPSWVPLMRARDTGLLKPDDEAGTLLMSLRACRLSELPAHVSLACRPFFAQQSMLPIAEEDAIDRSLSKDGSKDGSKDDSAGKASVDTTVSGSTRGSISGTVSHVGTLTVTVISGVNLPAADRNGLSDPFVKIRVGANRVQTKVQKATLNPTWNETFTFQHVHVDDNLVLKVRDHDVVGKNAPLGQFECNVGRLGQVPREPFDREMDLFISDKDTGAHIKVRVVFEYTEDSATTASRKTQKSLQKKLDKFGGLVEPTRKQYQVRVYIYQGRNLPQSDANGGADPFLNLRLAGRTYKTRVVKNSLNPHWNETAVVTCMLPHPLSMAPRLTVTLYDDDINPFNVAELLQKGMSAAGVDKVTPALLDKGLDVASGALDKLMRVTSDDFVGRVSIDLAEVFHAEDAERLRGIPTWYSLEDKNGVTLRSAQLLLGVQVFPGDVLASLPPPKIAFPPLCDFTLHVALLGARDLSSFFGVHKPCLCFTVEDGFAKKLFKSNRSKIPSARSPNFLQLLKIPIKLPAHHVFAPSVKIEAIDHMFGGLVKRQLGEVYVDLTRLLKRALSCSTRHVLPRSQDLQLKLEAGDEEALSSMADLVAEDIAVLTPVTKPRRSFFSSARTDEEDSKEDEEDMPLIGGHMGGRSDDSPNKAVRVDDGVDVDIEEGGDEGNYAAPVVPEDDQMPAWLRGRATLNQKMETIAKSPFETLTLMTGNALKGKGREVGQIKSIFALTNDLVGESDQAHPLGLDVAEFLRPMPCILRLYVKCANSLVPKDRNGSVDPYLKIKLGKKTISTRDRRLKRTTSPEFYESFEMPIELPGAGLLHVQVYDWDGLLDDMVGETVIDLENRWFSQQWRNIWPFDRKPLEKRSLMCRTSTVAQGQIELCVEMMTPEEAKVSPLWDITPPPPVPYELRLVIWRAKDCAIKDTLTDMNDLFCAATLDIEGVKMQRTDTHYRSQNGKGSFNWRMKFPVELPRPKGSTWPRLRLQVWDKDLLSTNDAIAEASISLAGFLRKAMRSTDRVVMKRRGSERFWLELRHPDQEGSQAKLEVSLQIVPKSLCPAYPAGLGRGEPNMNPSLPPPEGRMRWTLNPFSMMRQLMGNRFCCKCILLLLLFLFILSIPMMFSNIMQKIMFPFL